MAVYLFTYHAYRSWNADNPRGYVRRNQGILSPSMDQARKYDRAAKQASVEFSTKHQQVILWILSDACGRRAWRLHYVACEPTHVHLLVSWRQFVAWQDASNKLKNLMSRELGRQFTLPGRRWFAAKGSRKRVRDRRHFEHLMRRYLPNHRGLLWKEGTPLPQLPTAAAEGYY